MIILVDTREQLPFNFAAAVPQGTAPVVKTVTLHTGDYGVEIEGADSESDLICIERKSLADLYGTFSTSVRRERFYKEAARMANFGYAAIVIEATMQEMMNPNIHLRHPTKTTPQSVFGTLFALATRHRLGVWPCPGREAAEQVTFKLLERWHRDANTER